LKKALGITAAKVGRQAFIQKCLEVSVEAEKDYRAFGSALAVDRLALLPTAPSMIYPGAQPNCLFSISTGVTWPTGRRAPSIWCAGMSYRHCSGGSERPGTGQ